MPDAGDSYRGAQPAQYGNGIQDLSPPEPVHESLAMCHSGNVVIDRLTIIPVPVEIHAIQTLAPLLLLI